MSRVSRSSDVLDFRSAITKQFSVIVPTTEGDLASVHYKSTTQEKRPDQPHMKDVLFSCLAEYEVEDTWGCQAVLVVLRSSHLESFFSHSFIVTLLQGSCDFKHSNESLMKTMVTSCWRSALLLASRLVRRSLETLLSVAG